MWSVFLFLGLLAAAAGLTTDAELSKSLEEALQEDEFVLSLKHIKPRRRLRGSIETIFAVDFPGSEHKFQLQLDRRAKRVVVELMEDGRPRSQHFSVDTINENTIIRSLIFSFNQRKTNGYIKLYVDCISQGSIPIYKSLREMFNTMRNPRLQVYRERKYDVEVDADSTIANVLNRNNCPSSFLDMMQGIEPSNPGINDITTQIRGDIPIIHDCDDNLLIKTINDLINVVKQLKEELYNQRQETKRLREYIERCNICRPASANQVRQTCSSNPPPCFPGVECYDTPEGPRCGRCPSGYVGNGHTCKPGHTCAERPCYPGVRCYDTVEGAQCGSCPAGYTGDGRRCVPRSGCETNPCSPGVQCTSTSEPPYYRCGTCPAGMTGNGTNCHDLDECDLAEPCDPRVKCTNLVPGFRCDACPPGFTGSPGLEGVGLEYAFEHRQRCHDIDECADGRNGGCPLNTACVNTEGSFRCGTCRMSYIENQSSGCRNQPGLCPDGTQCDVNSECIRTGHRTYTCK